MILSQEKTSKQSQPNTISTNNEKILKVFWQRELHLQLKEIETLEAKLLIKI